MVFVTTLRDLLSYLGLTLSLTAALSVTCLFLPSIREHPLLRYLGWFAGWLFRRGRYKKHYEPAA